ncbi:MAG: hypothetical protein AB8B91_01735 [Rubripirellula sp.]
MLKLNLLVLVCLISLPTQAQDKPKTNLEQQRMDLMRSRAQAIRFQCEMKGLPDRMQAEPLFRYDDVPRGYVDGAVWRWGKSGRPMAIVTTELHPDYLGGGPRVVYDFLSLADFSFSAISNDSQWAPSTSAVVMQPLPPAMQEEFKVGQSPSVRMFQMKRIMQHFSAHQIVSEENPEETKLSLRLLPRPIDRYQPSKSKMADGATFLFVAGRMPGVIVFLDTDGNQWQFGIGRLSAPSTLSVRVAENEVYRVPPNFGTWGGSYNASNSTAKIPQ